MSKQGQPLPMNQSLHKAWAGTIVGALFPVASWAMSGDPLPDDFQDTIVDLLALILEMALSGGLVGGAVYRTTNYEADRAAP